MTLTENLTASGFLDLDHMSYIHFSADVTSIQVKAISKDLDTQPDHLKSSDLLLRFHCYLHTFYYETPSVIEMCAPCIKK